MIQENNKTKSLEKIFDQAFNLWEKGKSLSEILAIFPEYQKELKELFDVIEFMKKEKPEIMPKKELLSNVLSQIDIPSVTKTEESCYIYREKPRGLKGRLSILQVLNTEKILNLMSKKIYVLAGVAVIVIAVVVGVYWQSQRAEIAVSPESQKLSYEIESLSQDITELEKMEQDVALETLDQDLLALGEGIAEIGPEETPGVDVSSIENLKNELDAELDGFLNDLTDLEGFEGDTSLDNLDTSLSGLTE